MNKVSIVTRTKDRPLFLGRALDSVARQTYTNYVHVIINDGGDKKVVDDLVQALPAEQKARTRVFHRDTASGAPDTIFTESIDRVDSEYFALHDDDDTWAPDFLQTTVGHLEANAHLGAVVVRTDKIIEAVDGDTITTKKTTQWMPDVKVVNLYRQCIDNQMTPISTLFRRSAYQEVGKFDSTLPVVGDWEFGVRLLMKYDVDFIDTGAPLAFYHHREYRAGAQGNTSFAGNDKHRYYTNLIMNRYLRAELAEGRLGPGYIMSQLKYNQSNMATIAKRLLPNFITKRVKRGIQN